MLVSCFSIVCNNLTSFSAHYKVLYLTIVTIQSGISTLNLWVFMVFIIFICYIPAFHWGFINSKYQYFIPSCSRIYTQNYLLGRGFRASVSHSTRKVFSKHNWSERAEIARNRYIGWDEFHCISTLYSHYFSQGINLKKVVSQKHTLKCVWMQEKSSKLNTRIKFLKQKDVKITSLIMSRFVLWKTLTFRSSVSSMSKVI
jgi:hypothetical protein